MSATARLLITVGVVLIAIGVLLPWLSKIGLGRLPGDLAIRRDGFQLYFPITTCIVLSAVASLVLWLLRR